CRRPWGWCPGGRLPGREAPNRQSSSDASSLVCPAERSGVVAYSDRLSAEVLLNLGGVQPNQARADAEGGESPAGDVTADAARGDAVDVRDFLDGQHLLLFHRGVSFLAGDVWA